MGRVLIFSDGTATDDEKSLIEKLEAEHRKSLNSTLTYKELSETMREQKRNQKLKDEVQLLRSEKDFWYNLFWLDRIF